MIAIPQELFAEMLHKLGTLPHNEVGVLLQLVQKNIRPVEDKKPEPPQNG